MERTWNIILTETVIYKDGNGKRQEATNLCVKAHKMAVNANGDVLFYVPDACGEMTVSNAFSAGFWHFVMESVEAD